MLSFMLSNREIPLNTLRVSSCWYSLITLWRDTYCMYVSKDLQVGLKRKVLTNVFKVDNIYFNLHECGCIRTRCDDKVSSTEILYPLTYKFNALLNYEHNWTSINYKTPRTPLDTNIFLIHRGSVNLY